MDFKALRNMSPEERRDTLEGTAEPGREKRTFMKELTPDQMSIAKDQLAQNAMMMASIQAEKKDAIAEFKARLSPVESAYTEAREQIKAQAIEVNEDCYVVRDYDSRQVHYVTGEGVPVHSRAMLPEERQFTLNSKLRDVI